MRTQRGNTSSWLGLPLVVVLSLLAGCARDPQVAKRKYFDKGSAYYQEGKYPEAEIEFRNAIKIDSRFVDAHYQLAQCYLKQSDWGHGSQELSRVIELDPANQNARTGLGTLLLADGKVTDARNLAQTVLKTAPQDARAESLLADVDAAQGNLAKALAEAQHAVELDPNRSMSYLHLAILQKKITTLPRPSKAF